MLGLNFLMKIETIVDVEKGVIQVWNGLRMVIELLPLCVVNMLQHVLEQAQSQSFHSIREAMQGLSLEDHLFNENAKLIDLDDDFISNSEMNDSGSDVDDYHELILQSEHMYVENLMDQGLNELIPEETPTQMVNLII